MGLVGLIDEFSAHFGQAVGLIDELLSWFKPFLGQPLTVLGDLIREFNYSAG